MYITCIKTCTSYWNQIIPVPLLNPPCALANPLKDELPRRLLCSSRSTSLILDLASVLADRTGYLGFIRTGPHDAPVTPLLNEHKVMGPAVAA